MPRLPLASVGAVAGSLATAATARGVPVVAPADAASHIGQEFVVERAISDVGHSNHTFTAVISRSNGTVPQGPNPERRQ